MGGNANSEVSSGLVVLGELQMEKNNIGVLDPALVLTGNLLWLPRPKHYV